VLTFVAERLHGVAQRGEEGGASVFRRSGRFSSSVATPLASSWARVKKSFMAGPGT
jgi:hypothetical protein